MYYYVTEYEVRDGRRYPKGVEGNFTSIDLGTHAVVASDDLPTCGEQLCAHPKEHCGSACRILSRKLNRGVVGTSLGISLAQLLMYGHPRLMPTSPPRAWTAIHGPAGEIKHIKEGLDAQNKYQIWLGNEVIWEQPCIHGGLADPTISDNFNRLPETPLDTSMKWTTVTGRTLPDLVNTTAGDVTTGLIKAVAAASPDSFRHRAARIHPSFQTFTGNHSAQIDATPIASTVGPTTRHQSSADTFYYGYYVENNPVEIRQDLFLSKFIGGAETVLGSSIGITTNAFNTSIATIRLEANGSTIKVSFVGTGFSILTTIITVSDAAISGGQPGFDISSRSGGIQGGPLDQKADNFECDGDVEGAQFGQPLNC